MATTPQTKPLIHILDEELRYSTRDNLSGYTITSEGKIYDPEGNEIPQRMYRGKPTASVGGLLIFLDYAVAKVFVEGYKTGMTIGYRDGDKTNVTADNLFWRPRILPKPAEEPTAETPTPQMSEERWIRRYDKATCQLIAEYTSWREAFTAIQTENPATRLSTIKPKLRSAMRYGNTAYDCLWRASSPSMLGRGAHGDSLSVLSEPPTPNNDRPKGWIKCYALDGQLVRKYADLDECIADIMSISQQKPAAIVLAIRHVVNCKTKTFCGMKWEVSDESVLRSERGQLLKHRRSLTNTPQSTKSTANDKDYHPTPETPSERTGEGERWIRRYVGDRCVGEYDTLEAAVQAMSRATSLSPIEIATNIRQVVRQPHKRYLGCRWRASGEDALRWIDDTPPRPRVTKPTEQPTEQEETREPQPAPQPTESVKPQRTEQTDTPSKPSPSLHQPYEVEVETSGDVEVEVGGVTVKVSVTDKSRVRICVRSNVRE